MGYVQLRFFTS